MRLVVESSRLIPVWAWIIPISGILITLLSAGPLLPWFVGKYSFTGKDCQEVLGPIILLAALTLALFHTSLRPSEFRVWLTAVPLVFLCREIHFRGTGTGVYLGLTVLVYSATAIAPIRRDIMNNKALCGWWFGAGALYGVAISLDIGIWKFLPNSQWWSVNLEESLESAGHLAILLGVLSECVQLRLRISATTRRSMAAYWVTHTGFPVLSKAHDFSHRE